MPDKFSAVWVSHSSMSDFLECPRLYYLKNVYRNPRTGKKVQLISPALSLGSAVHEVIESLSVLPTEERLKISLLDRFEKIWGKYQGQKGGFLEPETEARYKQRGEEMLRRVMAHPGPLSKPAVKIREELPWFWLSEPDNIILCGKIDWLEYLPEKDAVHIVDFKSGRSMQDDRSLQLPIYHLLVHYCQRRKVEGASYWYLELDEGLVPKPLPDLVEAEQTVLGIAKKINTARKLKHFPPNEEKPSKLRQYYELIVEGKAEFVGSSQYGQEQYIIPKLKDEDDSFIL